MPTFRVALPVPASDPADVDAFLSAQGFPPLDGSSLNADGTATVITASDPTQAMASFTNAPTAAQTQVSNAVAVVRAYVQAVRAIAPASRTPEQKALLAMSVLIRDLAQASQ